MAAEGGRPEGLYFTVEMIDFNAKNIIHQSHFPFTTVWQHWKESNQNFQQTPVKLQNFFYYYIFYKLPDLTA